MIKKLKNRIKLCFWLIPILALSGFIFLRRIVPANRPPSGQLPAYTAQTLSVYNGDNPNQPVLLALDGYVYDVSSGRETFYAPGQSYHYLTGRDSSADLHLVGADIIRRKYPVVGIFYP